MTDKERLEEIEAKKSEWEKGPLKESLARFGTKESPNRFYTPLDVPDFDFLEDVGFPGQYPFTAGKYAVTDLGMLAKVGVRDEKPPQLIRAGLYSGYGTPEDTRDYYKAMQARGLPEGPNIAFDLPTQCGYDSDDPLVRGEVGKVGVAVDTLRDFEVIYEVFTGDMNLDRIASNWTINAPANIILAMYIALAEKRGIPLNKLRGTPQNDILKEFVARGTYIFPPKPSMRLIRDTIVYCTENMPLMNIISIGGYHIREAGATASQAIAFTLSNAIAYINLGIETGLDIDNFVRRFTFLIFGGSMEIFPEAASRRAARRVWAKIMKERFKAKNPSNWRLRDVGSTTAASCATVQRPLNNLTRSILTAISSALTTDVPACYPFYDEALGLGGSLEARQLAEDATRILIHEAKLSEVIDPLAGSYYFESLTDKFEAEIWEIINKVEAMGGAAAAVEKGYVQREIARSAYQQQKEIETGERIIVGVNKFTGPDELEVSTTRLVPHPYDPAKRVEAEEKQIANLTQVKKDRDNQAVEASLKRLKEAARDESENTIPPILESVKLYTTLGEMCNVLRDVFGEYGIRGL